MRTITGAKGARTPVRASSSHCYFLQKRALPCSHNGHKSRGVSNLKSFAAYASQAHAALQAVAALSNPTATELGWRTDLLDVYDVREPIGSGGFGQVHLAVHKQSGIEVAVKTMSKERKNLPRQTTLDKICREVGMLHSANACPGAARLIGCFEDRDSVNVVTELCRGGDLKKHVDTHGTLDEATLALAAFEALKIIQGCHALDIVYADVKPANFCLVDTAGFSTETPRSHHIKVVDFGCSQRITGSKRLSRRTGTLAFMAPEIFMKDFAHKADVWSTGVMLYWLYAKRIPFWDNSDASKFSSIDHIQDAVSHAPIRYDYGPWRHMSAEGLDFMRACLTRPEAARLSVEEALRHPWLAKHGRDRELQVLVNSTHLHTARTTAT